MERLRRRTRATVDTQGRSPVDPADQWVLNPATGAYELRLQTDEPSAVSALRQTGAPTAPLPKQGTRRKETPVTPSGTGRRAASRGRAAGGRSGGAGPGGLATSRRKAKPKRSGRRKALLWTAGSAGFALVAVSVGGYLVYEHINGNISTVDTAGIGSSSVTTDGPVNILVIGTDSRQGLKGKYGDSSNVGHADTTLLFHVSKDRSNATVLSIPRDLITNIPGCPTKQPDGSTKTIPGTDDTRFNVSLGQDGRDPGCVMRTVKDLTGVTPDHFMMANFDAVKDLSTAVGGVEVCLAKDINDSDSHLDLPAGRHRVQGEQALAFVRTRHSVGFGGDLSRIQLQQQFLSSMIREMKSSDTLTNPKKLFALANTATKALTVDRGIGSVNKLVSLAKDLSKVNPKNITFATVPVIDNPAEKTPTTVVLDKTKAPQLFSMVKHDISLTEVKKKQKAAAAAAAAKLDGPKADAVDVRVEVFNGSGQFGAAQSLVEWLQNNEGVTRSTNGGNAPAQIAKTTLEYAPNQADQARRLADMMGLSASALKEGTKDAAFRANMTLTLGKDFTAAGTPVSAPSAAPSGIQKVEASDRSVCAK
jgi:LCP family protein required for cell wall assembly